MSCTTLQTQLGLHRYRNEKSWQTGNVKVLAKALFQGNPKYRVCQFSTLHVFHANDSFHEDPKYEVC